jgi:hypothetical protein
LGLGCCQLDEASRGHKRADPQMSQMSQTIE